MSNKGGQAFNSEEFKAQQRQAWDNASAAAGWQARRPTRERREKVSDKVVNISEIKPGGKVLDIATCI
jgi:hypothetical protein